MERLIRTLLRYRAVVFVVVAISGGLSAWGASTLKFDAHYRDIFRSNGQRYATFRQLLQEFDAGENTVYVMLESGDILSRKSLQVIESLQHRLDDLASTDSVVSIFRVRRQNRRGNGWLMPRGIANQSDQELSWATEDAMRHPLVFGRLVSPDRTASLIAVRISDDRVTTAEVAETITEIRHVVADLTHGTGMTSGLTGLPEIRVATVQSLERDNIGISLMGAGLATTATWLIFGNFGAVIIVGLPPMIGVLWTLGAASVAGHTLGTFDIVVPALLVVIGDADAIHLLSHMRKKRLEGFSNLEASVNGFTSIGPACLLTSLTTAIGFASLAICDDVMVRTFGIYAATGVVLTFFSVLILVPLLSATLGIGDFRSWKSVENREQPSLPVPTGSRGSLCLAAIINWIEARHRFVTAAGFVVAVAFAALSVQLRSDWAFTENLASTGETARILNRLEEKFGGMPLVHVVVQWPEPLETGSRPVMAALSSVHKAVEDNPVTTSPFSILTVVRSLDGNTDHLRRRIRLSPELSGIANPDKRIAVVVANVPDRGAASLREPLDRLEQSLARLREKYTGFSIELSGFSVLGTYRTNSMMRQLVLSLGVACLVILIVISLALRSLRIGLASIIPNILPLLATAAVLVAWNIPLQFASILAFSICLGIAVDDTIHFLGRYRFELSRNNNNTAAVRHAFLHVAPAVIATTVILLLGFGAATLTSIPTVRIFGGLSCIAILVALVGDLFLLPAILMTLFGSTNRKHVTHDPDASESN